MTIGIIGKDKLVCIDETGEGAALTLSDAAGMTQDVAVRLLEDLSFERALCNAENTREFIDLLEQCVARNGSEIARRNTGAALIFAICWLRRAVEEGRL